MRTKHLLVLAWWLALFSCLQISALILDRFHYLEWGRLGIHLLKACYLGFACVLFMRYLSFRAQKNFENLVESYNRVAKTEFEAEKIRKDSLVNPFLNLILVVLASVDFTLVFQWNQAVLNASIWLDFLIWALILRWLGRTFWLKTKGTRERLKEVLDDARSRMRTESPARQVMDASISKAPFAALSLASLAVALSLSFLRWREVRDVFRIDDLKACMEASLREASYRYYHQGELRVDVAGNPCMLERKGRVDMTLDFNGGDLRLRAAENDTVDYFGNRIRGDQGLILDENGRFYRTRSLRAQNRR